MSRARIRVIVRQFSQNGMKLLLQDPRNVRDLLAVQETELSRLIDFGQAKLIATTFVQRDYRHIEADVVLRAPLIAPGRPKSLRQVTIYILIEHQSEPDVLMPFRMLEYVLQVYKAQVREWHRQHKSAAGIRLHPVLPVVFYTGTRRWDSLGQLADLVELGEKFASVIPSMDKLFLNLASLPAQRLETEAGFFGWVLRLVQLRRARPAEFQNLLHRAVSHLEAMPAEERLRWLELLSYIHALVYHEREPDEIPRLQEEIEESVETDEHRKEVFAMGQSYADVLIEKGVKRGRREGRREGRQEGQQEESVRSRRQILLNLLAERFGELPAKTLAAIETAKNAEQLDQWLRRLVKADRLTDVGIG